jgi:hypothetical protein
VGAVNETASDGTGRLCFRLSGECLGSFSIWEGLAGKMVRKNVMTPKEQETIIGLLKKRECPEGAKGAVRVHMQPLGEKTLVSADTPLLEFIQDDSLDRIVIGGTKIYGLVTRSDLLKLPVSLLGFALTMHAETLMLNIIRSTRISEKIWLTWVPRHKVEIQSTYVRLVSKRTELDKLELTYITDKSEILGKLATSEDPGLEEFKSHLPDKFVTAQVDFIQSLDKKRKAE